MPEPNHVYCSSCTNKIRRVIAEPAEDSSWEYDEDDGWLCPHCQE